MSELESLGGDSIDADQPQEGNRPAQNARLTTPGHLSKQGYQGGDGANDFLGLDAEMGTSSEAFELMSDTGGEPEASAPEPSAWVETSPGATYELSDDDSGFDGDGFEAQTVGQVHAEEGFSEDDPESTDEVDEPQADASTYASDEELHGSWSESEPKRGGAGKLVGAVAGMLVLGALGAAGMKFMGAAQDQPDEVGPLASRPQVEPANQASVLAPVEDFSGDQRVEADELESQAGLAAFDGDESAPDADAARDAFEAQRGDAPPVWFDPELDSQAEPTDTGWTEEAEAVTRASTFIGDPTAFLAMDADDQPSSSTTTAAVTETGTEDDAEPRVYVIGGGSVARSESDATQATEEDAGTVEDEPAGGAVDSAALASLVTGSQAAQDEASEPEQVEPATTTPVIAAAAGTESTPDVPVAAAAQTGAVTTDVPLGPAVPAGGATPTAANALAAHQDSRASRTSKLAVEDVLLAPTMDSSNLRQADAKDLKGVWNETTVPMEALGNKTKVLTPNVGRVRVVLKSKDIFEGKLYAVGQGSVWLESEYGRISVDGKRIASVAQIDTKEGTPALGSTGSQNLNGLEKVRVKTPGGTFYGKVISRDDKETTLITEGGARLTLANADVEFLTDVPKVTIGGKVDDKNAKTDKKP